MKNNNASRQAEEYFIPVKVFDFSVKLNHLGLLRQDCVKAAEGDIDYSGGILAKFRMNSEILTNLCHQ